MSVFDLRRFADTARRIRQKALDEGRLTHNPGEQELEALAEREPEVRRTIYGNLVAESEPNSRAAMSTRNSVDDPFGEQEEDLLLRCEKALSTKRLISVDRRVGNEASDTTVRLTVPVEFAHVAYGGAKLFVPIAGDVAEPSYDIIMFPDEAFAANRSKPLPRKDITIRLAMLDDGRVVKIVRNSNYIGEYKKGVFAAEDWTAKTRRGGIFLHAGCREDYLQSAHGDYRTTRSLLVALSANGKTTTTCKALARKRSERSWLVQDDGGTLLPDGSFHGFEAGGVYVKTESLNPGEQPEVYYGLLRPGTFGENICVTEGGDLDFYNLEHTSNGRAVVQRRDLMHASRHIDVERIDNLILITRGPTIPAISRLTREQAVALMVLGQAMESSAGDPTQAGRIRSEFFYDPFVAGNRAEHARIFYEILQGLPDLHCYLINTGGIGEGDRCRDIRLEYTLNILDSLIRGGLEDWIASPAGFEVPAAVRLVDDIYLHPEMLYSAAEFEARQHELNRARHEAIEEAGGGLPRSVREAF